MEPEAIVSGTPVPVLRVHSLDKSDQRPFNALTPPQQARLLDLATLQSHRQRNKAIYSEGAHARFLYLIGSGLIRISRNAAPGRQQVMAFLTRGDVFGFADQGRYHCTARTISDVQLYRIPWTRMNDWLQEDFALQSVFLARAAYDLRQAQKHILMLCKQNVTQRLAAFFLEFMSNEEIYDAESRTLSLPLSRFDIAEYLGTRPETIVRALAQLESMKFIMRTSSRNILVLSPEGLADILAVGPHALKNLAQKSPEFA